MLMFNESSDNQSDGIGCRIMHRVRSTGVVRLYDFSCFMLTRCLKGVVERRPMRLSFSTLSPLVISIIEMVFMH